MTVDSSAFSLNELYSLLDTFQAASFPKHADLQLKQATIPFFLEVVRLACDKSSLESVGRLVPEAVRALDTHRAKALPLGGAFRRPEDWLKAIKGSARRLMHQLHEAPPTVEARAVARDVEAEQEPDLLGAIAQEVPVQQPATWGTGVEFVDPRMLCDHPAWRQHLGFSDAEEEEQLTDFIREHTTLHPFIVTGEGCASPPGTLLDGHRARRAAMDARVPLVPVIRRTDLTAEAEETLILKSALAGKHVRRLIPSKVFALEDRLYSLYSRGSGHRSDLGTCVGSHAGSSRRPDTVSVVARETNESRNAVANRRKVFGSPIASKQLKNAVDEGKLSLTAAADLVRHVESDNAAEVERAPDSAPLPVEQAQRELDAQLKTILGLPKARPEKKPPKRLRPNTYELPLDGTPVKHRIGHRTVLRRVVRVTDTHVIVEETDGRLPTPSPPPGPPPSPPPMPEGPKAVEQVTAQGEPTRLTQSHRIATLRADDLRPHIDVLRLCSHHSRCRMSVANETVRLTVHFEKGAAGIKVPAQATQAVELAVNPRRIETLRNLEGEISIMVADDRFELTTTNGARRAGEVYTANLVPEVIVPPSIGVVAAPTLRTVLDICGPFGTGVSQEGTAITAGTPQYAVRIDLQGPAVDWAIHREALPLARAYLSRINGEVQVVRDNVLMGLATANSWVVWPPLGTHVPSFPPASGDSGQLRFATRELTRALGSLIGEVGKTHSFDLVLVDDILRLAWVGAEESVESAPVTVGGNGGTRKLRVRAVDLRLLLREYGPTEVALLLEDRGEDVILTSYELRDIGGQRATVRRSIVCRRAIGALDDPVHYRPGVRA